MAYPIRARAAYYDAATDTTVSSDLRDIGQLKIAIIDRDDGPDVILTCTEILELWRAKNAREGETAHVEHTST